jgi:CheY-like chemotaxis protein
MEPPEARIWLVVEDDENDFILLKRALQRADPAAQLRWVRDGAEAKEYFQGTDRFHDRTAYPLPSVVLSDLKMPRCSGLELVQWVRQQPTLRTLPFIIFSASDQPADVGLAYQDGANWYLAKPSAFIDLVEMLRRLSENLSFSPWKAGK